MPNQTKNEETVNTELSDEDAALQAKVDAALDIAVTANGYEEIATWTDTLVAYDLIEHSSEFENYSPARLRRLVKNWQDRHGGDCIPITWASGPYGKKPITYLGLLLPWLKPSTSPHSLRNVVEKPSELTTTHCRQ